jgi:hypothetical protein
MARIVKRLWAKGTGSAVRGALKFDAPQETHAEVSEKVKAFFWPEGIEG